MLKTAVPSIWNMEPNDSADIDENLTQSNSQSSFVLRSYFVIGIMSWIKNITITTQLFEWFRFGFVSYFIGQISWGIKVKWLKSLV